MKGHVRERGKGNWYAVLSTRDQQTGKRKVKFISLPDAGGKREAQQALAHILAELDSGTLVEPKKTTAAVFLARWLVHVKTQIGAASFERYRQYTNVIIPILGAVPLTKLRPEQISEMYSKALDSGRHDGKGGLSPRTVHQIHTMLKQALTQACAWRAIPYNPAVLVKPPKVPRKEMKTIDTDLRHSHATHLLAAGVHPKIAQERLGHSSIAITMDTYSHAMPNMQADAAARIDAAMQTALNKPKTK